MTPNGLWYGIQMPVTHDEVTTSDNPIKVYYFGWEEGGKKRGYGRPFFDHDGYGLMRVVMAADAHRTRTGKTGHHVIGRAIMGTV